MFFNYNGVSLFDTLCLEKQKTRVIYEPKCSLLYISWLQCTLQDNESNFPLFLRSFYNQFQLTQQWNGSACSRVTAEQKKKDQNFCRGTFKSTPLQCFANKWWAELRLGLLTFNFLKDLMMVPSRRSLSLNRQTNLESSAAFRSGSPAGTFLSAMIRGRADGSPAIIPNGTQNYGHLVHSQLSENNASQPSSHVAGRADVHWREYSFDTRLIRPNQWRQWVY